MVEIQDPNKVPVPRMYRASIKSGDGTPASCGTACTCAPGTSFAKLMRKSNDQLIALIAQHKKLQNQAEQENPDLAQMRALMDEMNDIESKVFDLIESNWDRSQVE